MNMYLHICQNVFSGKTILIAEKTPTIGKITEHKFFDE